MVHHGNAKIEALHGSKKHKQAVATVTEGERVVTRKVVASIFSPDVDPSPKAIRLKLIEKFNVVMPSRTKWSVRNTKWNRIMEDQVDDEGNEIKVPVPTRRCQISGTVTGTVPGSTINHFLIGKDETRNFISPLPRQAKSVTDAHRMLRPKQATKPGTRRQGEWFLVPVKNKKLLIKLNSYARNNPEAVRQRRLGGGTHKALGTIRYRRHGIYARGYIVDPRRGHHKAIFLPKWHQVVKNKEADIQISNEQRSRANFRRARYRFD